MTVDLNESSTITAESLHDEAFSAEKARTETFMEMHGKLDIFLGSKEATLLNNQFPSGLNLYSLDGSGETGSKGDRAKSTIGVYRLKKLIHQKIGGQMPCQCHQQRNHLIPAILDSDPERGKNATTFLQEEVRCNAYLILSIMFNYGRK